MAQVYFKIGIPLEEAERISEALLTRYGYEPIMINPFTGEQQANSIGPEEFQLNIFEKFIKEEVKAHEVPTLALNDRAARMAEIDQIEFSIELLME